MTSAKAVVWAVRALTLGCFVPDRRGRVSFVEGFVYSVGIVASDVR